MPLSIQLLTGPVVEPVTLDQAKNQLRVDFSDDDALITGLIIAARQYAEKFTRRAFFNQTWQRSLDFFPLWSAQNGTVSAAYRDAWPYYASWLGPITIDLPMSRTVSITGITYFDSTGTQQTLPASAYYVDTSSIPGRIVPAQGYYWPLVSTYQPGGVCITYVAGSYGDGVVVNTIPQTIVQAILLLISHWYQHREAASELSLKNIPLGVDALLSTERVRVFKYRP